MGNLAELKQQVFTYCEKVKLKGGKILEYNCPDCQSSLITRVPNKKGEVWDTATRCYECGETHFIVEKFEGVTATSLKEI